jgi:hypothetical protein
LNRQVFVNQGAIKRQLFRQSVSSRRSGKNWRPLIVRSGSVGGEAIARALRTLKAQCGVRYEDLAAEDPSPEDVLPVASRARLTEVNGSDA